MKLNKRVIEGLAIATAGVMLTVTAFAGSRDDNTGSMTQQVMLSKNGKAGIVVEIGDMTKKAVGTESVLMANIEKADSTVVSTSQEEAEAAPVTTPVSAVADPTTTGTAAAPVTVTEADTTSTESTESSEAAATPSTETGATTTESTEASTTETPATEAPSTEVPATETPSTETPATETPSTETPSTETPSTEEPDQADPMAEWANKVMANVEDSMNIRSQADENSEIVGKFYRGDVADVVSNDGTWTQITAGNVTGFVKNEYLAYGTAAFNLASQVCTIYATVNTDGLRLRSEPSEDAGIVTTAATNDKLEVDKTAAATDGWVAVKTSDSTAYVSGQFVTVAFNLGTPLNNDEVAQKEAEAAKKKAAEAAKSAVKQKGAVAASVDDVTLLGALIQCEAGGSSYDGMLAVGAVVMNRVRSGYGGGTISGVIYQSGQFPPATNGSVASVINRGVNGSCLQAAQDAINGSDNTNGARSFRSGRSGYAGTMIGANVFF